MKLKKSQLKRLIRETLEINEARSIVNFRKIRKDLSKLKKDINNQDLLDKVQGHMEDLKDKVAAGETRFMKGRYREAVTLLRYLEDLMSSPTPKKAEKAEKIVIAAEKKEKKPKPKPGKGDKDTWVPDPKPEINWEYQVRDCVWYTRKKGETKEYKLGHVSGNPVDKQKFLNSISTLNAQFPELVKDCGELYKKKPKPKPKRPDPVTPDDDSSDTTTVKYFRTYGDNNDLYREVVTRLKVKPEKIVTSTTLRGALQTIAPHAAGKIKRYFDDPNIKRKLKTLSEKNVWDATNEIVTQILNPHGINVLASAASETVVSFCVQLGDKIAIGYLSETDLVPNGSIDMSGNTPSKGFSEPTFPAKISKDLFDNGESSVSEGLSRGSLYRKKYWGRY